MLVDKATNLEKQLGLNAKPPKKQSPQVAKAVAKRQKFYLKQ